MNKLARKYFWDEVLRWRSIWVLLPFGIAFLFNRIFQASENFSVGLMQVSGTMLTITVVMGTFGYDIIKRLVEYWTNRLLSEKGDFEQIRKRAIDRISEWNNILQKIWFVAFYLFLSVISSAFGAYCFKSSCISQFLVALSIVSFVTGCIFIIYFQFIIFIDVRKNIEFIKNMPSGRKP